MSVRQTGDVKYVGSARITQHDVMATNGVIHVIDSVLRPSTGANAFMRIICFF